MYSYDLLVLLLYLFLIMFQCCVALWPSFMAKFCGPLFCGPASWPSFVWPSYVAQLWSSWRRMWWLRCVLCTSYKPHRGINISWQAPGLLAPPHPLLYVTASASLVDTLPSLLTSSLCAKTQPVVMRSVCHNYHFVEKINIISITCHCLSIFCIVFFTLTHFYGYPSKCWSWNIQINQNC